MSTGPARKFRRSSIEAGDYECRAGGGLREQVENGANIIDVNMDQGLLDSEKAIGDLPLT